MLKIKPVTGQAARMINLFTDVRNMPMLDFFEFIKALNEFRIRDAIFTEIGHDAVEESTDTDRN